MQLSNTLLLKPVLDALEGLSEADLGVTLEQCTGTHGEGIEIYAGHEFAVDLCLVPPNAHLPIVDPQVCL